MLSHLLLLSALAAVDSVPFVGDVASVAPGADAGPVVRRAAPAIIVHRQPGVPVLALRLSVLADDPPGYAGAGHMIQHLLYPGLRDLVGRVGGEVEIHRTSDAVIYSVSGPTDELEYLAGILRRLLEPPRVAEEAILLADRELREERLAEWETAGAHARSVLRSQLFPADISVAGTDRSATRFTPASLAAAWEDMYRPERVAVLAVGDVFLADVLEAFADLPAAGDGPLTVERDSVVLGALAPAQATRAWVGAAYLASDLDPAAVSVATNLLGEVVRARLPNAQVDAEHWWTHHGQAVALIAAVPGRDLATARRAVGTAVGALLEDLDFLTAVDAATAIRREMLFYSRTPRRMAELVGRFVDREGDPSAAERYYAALDALDDEEVREVLERLLERTPARVEIPPQQIPERFR